MKLSVRFTTFSLCVFGLTAISFGQSPAPVDDGTAAVLSKSSPGYVRVTPRAINPAQASPLRSAAATSGIPTIDFPANAKSSRAIFATTSIATGRAAAAAGASPAKSALGNASRDNDSSRRANASTIDGLDSLATFSGAFINQAGPDLGTLFPFIFIGNPPVAGGTTVIPAQITTVSLRLLNADGTLNVNVPFVFKDLFEDSPNFAETNYRSGRQIQYSDAVHRAQFFNTMGENWHTVLRPSFVNDVTFTIPRFVNIRFPDGSVKAVQAYRVGTASDGNHFVLLLDILFEFLFENQVINDINAGNFTTDALSNTLLPNTFLFSIDNNGNEAGCCVLGFHTYFLDPTAIPQPRWVTQFASWISPGIFGGGFADVTALSHETAEAFADPFVNNATANWQFPGVPADSTFCQNNLEEGDPIEVLANATVPIKLRERREVFTYHPQIIPLLQWFEMGAKSNAIDGAFSFPDETALTHSALPCPQ